MAEYRVYCLDGAGKIESVHNLEANSDDAAMKAARQVRTTLGVRCGRGTGLLVASFPTLNQPSLIVQFFRNLFEHGGVDDAASALSQVTTVERAVAEPFGIIKHVPSARRGGHSFPLLI